MITVTQENLHLLLPHKIGKICAEMTRNNNPDLLQNIVDFYNSNTSEMLHQEDLKYWWDSWNFIYSRLLQEKENK